MHLDLYECLECGRAFAVEQDEEPKVCSSCESDHYEFSATIEFAQIKKATLGRA
nr:hypothetical protein 17 [Bacillales bacterium]